MGIADARALLAERTNIEVFWRPEPNLPEPEQYALVYEG
jgi:hypothetical protein